MVEQWVCVVRRPMELPPFLKSFDQRLWLRVGAVARSKLSKDPQAAVKPETRDSLLETLGPVAAPTARLFQQQGLTDNLAEISTQLAVYALLGERLPVDGTAILAEALCPNFSGARWPLRSKSRGLPAKRAIRGRFVPTCWRV